MSNHDKAPKIGTKAKAGLVGGGVTLALIAGGIGYKKGESDQARSDSQHATATLISRLIDHPKPLERLKFVESQTAESIEKLKGEALLENVTKVQGSILAISTELGMSGQEVFERLVSSEAQDAYKNNHVSFLFVEDDPSNPDCLNPSTIEVRGRDGQWTQIFIPLDASPDNAHPDHSAPDQTWIPEGGI